MTKRTADFGKSVATAARAAAEPRQATAAEGWGAPVPFNSRLPHGLLMDVRELALRLTREAGRRVTITDLVAEALEDLLAKHKERKKA